MVMIIRCTQKMFSLMLHIVYIKSKHKVIIIIEPFRIKNAATILQHSQ